MEASYTLNTDLDCIAAWIKANKLKMSISKTQLMTLGRRTSGCTAPQIDIHLKGSSIPQSDSIECLVVTVDQDLRWGQGTLPIHQECTKLHYESLPQSAPRTPNGILKDQCGSTSLHKRHYSSLLHQVQLWSNKLSI